MRVLRARLLVAAVAAVLLTAGLSACGGGRQTAPPPPGTVPSSTETSGSPLFGASISPRPGESYPQALARDTADFGRMQAVRLFYAGPPAPWPGKAGQVDSAVVVSFKIRPQEVLSGRDDASMSRWFATAPRNHPVYWAYWHEPEDDIGRGAFTAAEYRDAWRHLATLAAAARNPGLKATLILMGYTLTPQSHRAFTDYYPGGDVIDVLGWDVYNLGYRHGGYDSPQRVFGAVATVSSQLHKPWGLAEMGSLRTTGDAGQGRAAWLLDAGAWLRAHGAVFALYFNSTEGGDYLLADAASQTAWRDVVQGRRQP